MIMITENGELEGGNSDKWIALGIALISIFVMIGVISNKFVNWDDPIYILNNYWIHHLSLSTIWEIFSHIQVNGSYVPLVHLSWAIDYWIWGPKPFGFHLTNLLIHGIVVYFVYQFILQLAGNRLIASLTALLWGIHPVNVEVVAWVSARKDLLYAVFLMPALLSWIRYINSRESRYYWQCFGLFILSVFSKGVAVMLPLILLLLDYYFGRREVKKLFLEKVPFFAISLILGIVAILGQPAGPVQKALADVSFSQKIYLLFFQLGTYLLHLIAPVRLSPFYSFPTDQLGQLSLSVYIIGIVTFLLLVLGLWVIRSRIFQFGLSFFALSVLPYLQIIPFGQSFTADRYLYVGSITILTLLVLSVVKWRNHLVKGKAMVTAFSIAFILFLAIQTVRIIPVWNSGYTLWSRIISQSPKELVGYMNLSDWYLRQGRRIDAWTVYQSALNAGLRDPELLNNIGYYLQQDQKYQDADNAYRDAILRDSTYSIAYLNRGLNFIAMGDTAQAVRYLNRFTEMDPQNPLAYVNKGVLYEKLKDFDQAIDAYTYALNLDPNNVVFLKYRAATYQRIGDFNRSWTDLEKALRINPQYADALYWRAKCQAVFGDFYQARKDLEAARNNGLTVDDKEFELLSKMEEEAKANR